MIRPARPEDIEALLDIEQRCFHHDRLHAADFRNALRGKSTLLLVAVLKGRVRGYALLRVLKTRARLLSLAVHPGARRSGLGRALIHAVERQAAARGTEHMRLELRERNRGAHALYVSLGYHQDGRLLEYYSDKSDARLMKKRLGGKSWIRLR